MATLLDTVSKVAGVTFDNENGENVQNILKKLEKRTYSETITLRFVREPDNSHDKNAIKIYIDDTTNIGHMTRRLAETVAPLMDSGCSVDGYITEITGGGELNYGCNYKLMVFSPVEEPLEHTSAKASASHKNAWLVLAICMIPITIICFAISKVLGILMLVVILYSLYRWHNYESIVQKESAQKSKAKPKLNTRMVYTTSNGQKYHYKKKCLGGKPCSCISESYAIACGLSKCNKCCN